MTNTTDYAQDNLAIIVTLKPISEGSDKIDGLADFWEKFNRPMPDLAADEEVSVWFLYSLDELKDLVKEPVLQEKLERDEIRRQTVYTIEEYLSIKDPSYKRTT